MVVTASALRPPLLCCLPLTKPGSEFLRPDDAVWCHPHGLHICADLHIHGDLWWRCLGVCFKVRGIRPWEKKRHLKKPASFSFEGICSVCFCSMFSDGNFRTTSREASPEIKLKEHHTLLFRAWRLPMHVGVLRVLRPLLTRASSSLLVLLCFVSVLDNGILSSKLVCPVINAAL